MLSPKHNLVYSRARITRDDGSFYDVVEVTAPDVTKLEFHKGIHCNSHLKLDDIAQLRMLKALARGIPKPTALLWDAYGHEEAIEEVDLMNQGTDMVHISKNSSITHHLRYLVETCNYVITDGRLQVKDLATEKDRKTQEILDLLYAQERIKLYQGDPDQTLEEIYLGFDPRKDVVSVGRIGLPSLHGRMGNYPIAFNTSFFLFEEEDYISEFSLLGDAYSLQIREGVIESPPLFNRSALLISTTGEVGLRQISLQDLKLKPGQGPSW